MDLDPLPKVFVLQAGSDVAAVRLFQFVFRRVIACCTTFKTIGLRQPHQQLDPHRRRRQRIRFEEFVCFGERLLGIASIRHAKVFGAERGFEMVYQRVIFDPHGSQETVKLVGAKEVVLVKRICQSLVPLLRREADSQQALQRDRQDRAKFGLLWEIGGQFPVTLEGPGRVEIEGIQAALLACAQCLLDGVRGGAGKVERFRPLEMDARGDIQPLDLGQGRVGLTRWQRWGRQHLMPKAGFLLEQLGAVEDSGRFGTQVLDAGIDGGPRRRNGDFLKDPHRLFGVPFPFPTASQADQDRGLGFRHFAGCPCLPGQGFGQLSQRRPTAFPIRRCGVSFAQIDKLGPEHEQFQAIDLLGQQKPFRGDVVADEAGRRRGARGGLGQFDQRLPTGYLQTRRCKRPLGVKPALVVQ